MIRTLVLLTTSFAVFSCADNPTKQGLPAAKQIIQVKPASDAEPAKRKVIERLGALGEFKLEVDPCHHQIDFVNATKDVARLVVGVAAGEMIKNRFVPRALGSGLIITPTGFILAHYHTVSEFEVIRVRLPNGKVMKAEWMGEDRLSDIVLLKIAGDQHPVPRISSASALAMGQWVVAVGSPFGLQQSVSAGIVSDNNRPYPSPGDTRLVRFVQSDVVIHPGSSGGPLIDACGRVVAMNSAILGAGMSFSLRIDEALVIAEKLYSDGEFDRGFIGLVLKRAAAYPAKKKMIIQRVVKGAPAHKAGLKAGDQIIKINSETISTHQRLKWLVAKTEPGDLITLDVKRGSQILQVEVEVDSRP